VVAVRPPATAVSSGAESAKTRATGAGRATGSKASASDSAAIAAQVETDVPAENQCGHRNMGNKSCQRSAGHAEKSHRYK
jgi:hypothetical protein